MAMPVAARVHIPIFNGSAIHYKVIAVSCRNRRASFAFERKAQEWRRASESDFVTDSQA